MSAPRPNFPHYSPELSATLGIPDSPAIHLAITTLTQRLIPLAAASVMSADNIRIVAMRTASMGVLASTPIECVEVRFLDALNLPFDATACRSVTSTSTDWLGRAIEQLTAEGAELGPIDPRASATRFGWTAGG